MKKAWLALFVLASLSLAGLGFAQKYGVYLGSGYDGMIGGQFYLDDNLRASLGITPLIGIAVGGSLDVILNKVPLGKDASQLQGYYGVGGGGGLITVAGTGVAYVQGHGLGGLEFALPESDVSLFGEVGVGPMMLFGSGGALFTFGYDVKMGAIFR